MRLNRVDNELLQHPSRLIHRILGGRIPPPCILSRPTEEYRHSAELQISKELCSTSHSIVKLDVKSVHKDERLRTALHKCLVESRAKSLIARKKSLVRDDNMFLDVLHHFKSKDIW